MALVLTRTRTELKQAVGRILGLYGAGESSLAAEHDAVIEDRVDDIYMMLSRLGLITFDIEDDSAIDIASFQPLADIIAATLVGEYDVPPEKAFIILQRGSIEPPGSSLMLLKRIVNDGVNDSTVNFKDY